MFLRWKKKNRRRKLWESSVDKLTLSAVIVKSLREDGKIRQKVVKYLGSIREEQISNPHRRRSFWRKVNQVGNDIEQCFRGGKNEEEH